MSNVGKSKLTIEKKRAVYCAINGHSNVITSCFGYVSCARCGAQIGDTIGGVYSNENAVIVGHACATCKENYKRLTKKDKTYLPRNWDDGLRM